MVDNDVAPSWRRNFDLVVDAATRRKKAGDDLDMTSILDAAGVDQNAWIHALRKAKDNDIAEVEAFYDNVLERKMRGGTGPRKVSEIAAAAGDDEEVDEQGEPGVTEADVLKCVIDALGHFESDKAGMLRTLRTVAMFYDLDLGAPRTQAVASVAAPIKAKRQYARRGPRA